MTETLVPPLPQIDDSAGAHLGTFIATQIRHLRGDLASGSAQRRKTGTRLSGQDCATALTKISPGPDHAATLRAMGAAFSAARTLDHPPPEGMAQTYWNRLLRDQGECLRAASMTLAAGRADVAQAQLSRVRNFLVEHMDDLPA